MPLMFAYGINRFSHDVAHFRTEIIKTFHRDWYFIKMDNFSDQKLCMYERIFNNFSESTGAIALSLQMFSLSISDSVKYMNAKET